ncbi:molybdopterin cofactor-binding domain-containing protein [Streptomyces sp. SID1034]|uniref:molybdopterin cofactor-binding domain-containing protein n=1 Tax=Streptomyces sp. SID1034 TaxID=2690248 RepID=UPI00136C78A3|nr:molybdopterin cofactor-binding domain-containing protein [Streptomyces sp. SID1034]MYV94074.1 molybdopterin-dependent oxidoreductase [Streptomyces sp. SID1034]
MASHANALGAPIERREGRAKVTGEALYATEYTPPGCLYAWPVTATVARGRIASLDIADALALPDVVDVLTPESAPRLGTSDDATLAVLQDAKVPHHGWPVAVAIAGTIEAARAAAEAVRVTYATEPHESVLGDNTADAYRPEEANGGHPAERRRGQPEEAFAAAPVRVDVRYRVPPLHNHPMEPHGATVNWHDGRLTVYDSSQGSDTVRSVLADLFGLPEEQVTVISEHVGGGFGSKGTPRPHVVLAAMASLHTGRPVKLALSRRQLTELVGHRAPTEHRLRLGSDADGTLASVIHEVTTHTSRVKEFVEQAAVPARVMYASGSSLTDHKVAALDVPTPSWMRAPGEAPGMYALESAVDELACALGLDPIELRARNEPGREPDSGLPFSSRHLVECLREGARRFGWADRDPRPGIRREGAWLTGTGVASATYPVLVSPSRATVTAHPDGLHVVRVNATDIGTGARTVLAQVVVGSLVLTNTTSGVYAVDLHTGDVKWHIESPVQLSPFSFLGRTIAASEQVTAVLFSTIRVNGDGSTSSGTGGCLALRTSDGKELWALRENAGSSGVPAPSTAPSPSGIGGTSKGFGMWSVAVAGSIVFLSGGGRVRAYRTDAG